MNNFNIYSDIADRTQGNIYVGVVGPARTGKSTFISRFMSSLVIPKIDNKHIKQRTIDDMPQSGNGKTITTTQPKFVPAEAVEIELDKNVSASFRLVDCVGYLVDGVEGATENGVPRLIKTPWSDELLTFEKASEVGTNKVISDHSSIGVLVTTDGSITELPRLAYVSAEEKCVNELKKVSKSFVIILNSIHPESDATIKLRNSLKEKYGVPVMNLNVASLGEPEILKIFETLLYEFPVKRIDFDLPRWVRALDYSSSLVQNLLNRMKEYAPLIQKINDYKKLLGIFEGSEIVSSVKLSLLKLGQGVVSLALDINPTVFYSMLSEASGEIIADDFALMRYLRSVAGAKKSFDKIKDALDSVEKTGYGVVLPDSSEMSLEEPQIVKRGASSAVRLKASAPSLHIMRVDVETEVTPQVGSEQQSEDLVRFLLAEFENNPQGIWDTNMFGKPLYALVKEGIDSKIAMLPVEAQVKMRKTLTKIVNENKGGIICILL